MLSLNFKYLNLFPRLFIWGCVFQSTSIWAAFVRFFGCSSRFQKDYSRNLPDSLLFRHTFRKGYFCIKFNFDTDMYGTFGASMVSSMLGQKINKCLSDQYNTKNFVCQHIHIIISYNGLPVHLSAKNKRVNRSLAATRLCAIFNPLLLPSDMLLQPQKMIPPSFWRLPDSSYPAYACLALLPVLLLTEPPSCPLHVRF